MKLKRKHFWVPYPRELRALLNVLTVKESDRDLGRIEEKDDIFFWERYSHNLGLKTLRHDIKEDKFLFIARNEDCIKKAIYHHFKAKSGHGFDNIVLGKLYGYPKCCVNHFNKGFKMMMEKKDAEFKLNTIRESKTRFFSPYINNFIGGFITHHVCSYQCEETIKIGKRNSEIIKKYSEKFHQKAIKAVQGCLLAIRNEYTFIGNDNFSFNSHEARFRMDKSNPFREKLGEFEKEEGYTVELDNKKADIFIFSDTE